MRLAHEGAQEPNPMAVIHKNPQKYFLDIENKAHITIRFRKLQGKENYPTKNPAEAGFMESPFNVSFDQLLIYWDWHQFRLAVFSIPNHR